MSWIMYDDDYDDYGNDYNDAQRTPSQYAAMEPGKVLRVMQIIAGALIAGVLLFAGVASFVVFGLAPAIQPAVAQIGADLLKYLAMMFAAGAVVLSFVVPNVISTVGLKVVTKLVQDGTLTGSKELFGRLLSVAQTKMIVSMALVEGAAFFNLIAFIITKSLIPPAVVGALLLVMAIHFPTKFKLARWLEDQQRLLS